MFSRFEASPTRCLLCLRFHFILHLIASHLPVHSSPFSSQSLFSQSLQSPHSFVLCSFPVTHFKSESGIDFRKDSHSPVISNIHLGSFIQSHDIQRIPPKCISLPRPPLPLRPSSPPSLRPLGSMVTSTTTSHVVMSLRSLPMERHRALRSTPLPNLPPPPFLA